MPNKVIGVITARGGSKRIPGKNIKLFCGKPLIAWTIEAALSCESIDQVIVSTDSEEIASISKQYGAQVPCLRRYAYDDYSPVSLATVATLEDFVEDCNIVVQLQAVHPLRTSHDISEALAWFLSGSHKFQLTAQELIGPTAWWACEIGKNGEPKFLFPELLQERTQDLPKLFVPNGAVMIADYDSLMASRTFYGDGFLMHRLPYESCFDIDDLNEFEQAEKLMHARSNNELTDM